MKNEGWTWHPHHDILCEWCYDFTGRVDIIRRTKSPNEIPTRLRLFKFVAGKVPAVSPTASVAVWNADEDWVKANRLCDAAFAVWLEASADTDRGRLYAAWKKAYAKRLEASVACEKANEAWRKAYADSLSALEALHAQECGCQEWNGKEIVFPKQKATAKK